MYLTSPGHWSLIAFNHTLCNITHVHMKCGLIYIHCSAVLSCITEQSVRTSSYGFMQKQTGLFCFHCSWSVNSLLEESRLKSENVRLYCKKIILNRLAWIYKGKQTNDQPRNFICSGAELVVLTFQSVGLSELNWSIWNWGIIVDFKGMNFDM